MNFDKRLAIWLTFQFQTIDSEAIEAVLRQLLSPIYHVNDGQMLQNWILTFPMFFFYFSVWPYGGQLSQSGPFYEQLPPASAPRKGGNTSPKKIKQSKKHIKLLWLQLFIEFNSNMYLKRTSFKPGLAVVGTLEHIGTWGFAPTMLWQIH